MSKTTRQNSVLLIATLGVYFGLVLAGAPQVLSNAALTRSFDVREEIELVDELDNKPDQDERRSPVTASVQVFVEDVETFLTNLAKLQQSGRFDATRDSFQVAQNTLLPCTDSGRAGRYTPIKFDLSSEPVRPALEYLSRGMVYGYSLGDCIATPEFDVTAVESRFNFGLDGKDFLINVRVRKDTPVRAVDLAADLQYTLDKFKAATDSKIRQAVIKYTTFKAENDQVFVTTRLPRGSLAALLNK